MGHQVVETTSSGDKAVGRVLDAGGNWSIIVVLSVSSVL